MTGRAWLLALLAFGTLAVTAAAQGFWNNCAKWTLGWEGETVYRRFMVAECKDPTGNTRASFLPLNDCVTNKEGQMLPMRSGGVAGSCAHCTHVNSTMTCQCGRTWGEPTTSSIDLDAVIKNVDGILGCFDFMGVEIGSMDSSPA